MRWLRLPTPSLETTIKYGLALIGLAIGYGKMQSDVENLKDNVRATRVQMDRIYEKLLWEERGNVGPAPPVATDGAEP